MIPPRILKELAQTLTDRTRARTTTWHRHPDGPQRYTYRLNPGEVVIRYDPSRGGEDTIELAVVDPTNTVIGSLVAQESEPLYDILADLLFEVQRATDSGLHQTVTDQILNILKP